LKTFRIIPRLDIKGPNLVKGIHFEGLRVLGSPQEFAKFYYEQGADELMYVDVVASLYNRNSLNDIISKTAKEISIPLLVGGGIRTIEDIRSVLRAGADRVSLNTAAITNPSIIGQAAKMFGSSTIVVTIEASKQSNGQYLAFTDNGREHTGIEVLTWAKKVEELGAGEIVLSSIDREGTGLGFDLELIKLVSASVGIPVIAHGGCRNPDDVVLAIREGKADGVSLASILHYKGIQSSTTAIAAGSEGNRTFMESGKTFSKITPSTIQEIKKTLLKQNIACRYEA